MMLKVFALFVALSGSVHAQVPTDRFHLEVEVAGADFYDVVLELQKRLGGNVFVANTLSDSPIGSIQVNRLRGGWRYERWVRDHGGYRSGVRRFYEALSRVLSEPVRIQFIEPLTLAQLPLVEQAMIAIRDAARPGEGLAFSAVHVRFVGIDQHTQRHFVRQFENHREALDLAFGMRSGELRSALPRDYLAPSMTENWAQADLEGTRLSRISIAPALLAARADGSPEHEGLRTQGWLDADFARNGAETVLRPGDVTFQVRTALALREAAYSGKWLSPEIVRAKRTIESRTRSAERSREQMKRPENKRRGRGKGK